MHAAVAVLGWDKTQGKGSASAWDRTCPGSLERLHDGTFSDMASIPPPLFSGLHCYTRQKTQFHPDCPVDTKTYHFTVTARGVLNKHRGGKMILRRWRRRRKCAPWRFACPCHPPLWHRTEQRRALNSQPGPTQQPFVESSSALLGGGMRSSHVRIMPPRE
jgi:hypothetical protein